MAHLKISDKCPICHQLVERKDLKANFSLAALIDDVNSVDSIYKLQEQTLTCGHLDSLLHLLISKRRAFQDSLSKMEAIKNFLLFLEVAKEKKLKAMESLRLELDILERDSAYLDS